MPRHLHPDTTIDTAMPAPTQAIIFLTHIENPRIAAHCIRMQRELHGLMPVFLCVHEPADIGKNLNRLAADFRVTAQDGERLFPERFSLMRKIRRTFNSGFPDLCYLPSMLDKRLSRYDYLWMIECDLDYSGNWRDFFESVMESQADLLTTTIQTRDQCPAWYHWSWFTAPPEVPAENHVRCFAPIARFSRRMLNQYVHAVSDQRWSGHTEALYGTIARHAGLVIEDLGGTGSFCPTQRRGQHYFNTPDDPDLSPGTLVYRPLMSRRYFHESPESFPRRDCLVHPVKPFPTGNGWRNRLLQVASRLKLLGKKKQQT